MSIYSIESFRSRYLPAVFYRWFRRKTCAERFELMPQDRHLKIDVIDGISVEKVREEAAWYRAPRSGFFQLCTWIASWFTGIRQRFALLVLYDAQCLQSEIAKGTKGQNLRPFYTKLESHQDHPLIHAYEGVQEFVVTHCEESRPLLSQELILSDASYHRPLDELALGAIQQGCAIQRGSAAYQALLLKQRWEGVDKPELLELKHAIFRVKYLSNEEKIKTAKDLSMRLKQYMQDVSKTYHPDKLGQQRGLKRMNVVPIKETYQAFPYSQYVLVKDKGLYYYDKIWSNTIESVELDVEVLTKIDALFSHEESVVALSTAQVQIINALIGKECSPAHLIFRDIQFSFESLRQEIEESLKIEKIGRSHEEIMSEIYEVFAEIRKTYQDNYKQFDQWMREKKEESDRRFEKWSAELEEQTARLNDQFDRFEERLSNIEKSVASQGNPIDPEPGAVNNGLLPDQGARFKLFPPANDATISDRMLFLKLSILPKLNRIILQEVFQGKNGMILVDDKLYSFKQPDTRLQEIPATEENNSVMTQIKSLFIDEEYVVIHKSTDLRLVASLLESSLPMTVVHRV